MTDYSRGDYADLPAGKTDLENDYSAPDLTAIASNDNSTYAEQTANNEIAIHQYKKTVTGQYTNITWSGKSSLAPSESPVILEVYNVTGTPAWEELDRDDSTAADTDFDLSYNNLATADYLDTGVITWRVWQAASGATPVTKVFGDTPTADYSGTNDAYINGYGPTLNYGASLTGTVGDGATSTYTMLISFTDLLNQIPVGATITDASLTVYFYNGGSFNVNAYRLLKDWTEGTGDGQAGVCNWTQATGVVNWTAAGALGSGTDRAASSSATAAISAAAQAYTLTGAQLITDIQNFVDSTWNYYGWCLNTGTDAMSANYITSKYTETQTARPYLTVTWTV